MFFLEKPSRDPWFNLAVEEYLLRQTKHDIFMLWQNAPSLILGKHQNPVIEINTACLVENKIPVIRRISGGGTVFHGPGNLNFSFITTSSDQEDKINFQRFTKPILDYLNSNGIPAEMTGKSNLTVNGLKFSGNAAHVFKNRSLHHGTLLFDADLKAVDRCLKKETHSIQTKAIQSIRAVVINLKPLFVQPISFENFQQELKAFIFEKFSITEAIKLTEDQMCEIQNLADQKYKTAAWNYGYSPSYQLTRLFEMNHFKAQLTIEVNKGMISTVVFENSNDTVLAEKIRQKLLGLPHHPEAMLKIANELASDFNSDLKLSKSILYQLF
ncbi:MAG: lipoate--protein ligase [Bacteroidales bacterium]|jgi:lipoate-protein ligase A|nr:lipoate--protein ligase [Bacteroidales bacterium]